MTMSWAFSGAVRKLSPSWTSCPAFSYRQWYLWITNGGDSSSWWTHRLIGPVAMGWGVTRQTVYNLLLRITCQSLEGDDSGDGKLVSEVFFLQAAIELTITSASAWAYHSMDSWDDQASRSCCGRQSYAWSSVRERISGPDGMQNFRIPLLKTYTPS